MISKKQKKMNFEKIKGLEQYGVYLWALAIMAFLAPDWVRMSDALRTLCGTLEAFFMW